MTQELVQKHTAGQRRKRQKGNGHRTGQGELGKAELPEQQQKQYMRKVDAEGALAEIGRPAPRLRIDAETEDADGRQEDRQVLRAEQLTVNAVIDF